MQIIFLSEGWMLTLFFILWTVFQVSAMLICSKIPDRYFSPNGFLFRERKWEKGGVFYEKGFKVRKWKRFLPDGAAVAKDGYRKKHLTDYSKENLERFLIETCRAELQHILSILPFWVFGLFAPRIVIVYMFVYALAVNLPCVIAQRYNRQRLVRVLKKLYVK
jgi:glycosyl-4,4'-diaponeurosporenoate acyltransferase